MTRINIKELAQQRYIQTPKLLLYGKNYKHLSGNAFKTYCALYDRFTLSIKNNWVDKEGNIYFVYDLKELQELTSIKKTAQETARKQLKEAGLLEEVSTGRNYKLYLSMPVPADEEEAKYIIEDNHDLKDTSEMSDDEKKRISQNLKGNKNSEKTDDSWKSTTAVETPTNQGKQKDEKQTIVDNQQSDSWKSTPNELDLSEPSSKDSKDNKESSETQNNIISNAFDSQVQENEIKLIEQTIQEQYLNEQYGEQTMQSLKIYSFGSYSTFKVYLDKFHFGCQSAEKELGVTINSYGEDFIHEELNKAFNRVIMKHKQGKTENVNNYLFTSLKNVFTDYGKAIKYRLEKESNPEEDTVNVPMINWLEGK